MKRFSKQDLEALRDSGLFDEKWYLEQYPDVKMLGMDPIEHYLWVGAKIGRKPSDSFDGAFYLQTNPDVAAAGVNPLLHFVRWGKEERRFGRVEAEDIHCSTFHNTRNYPFLSVENLERVSEAYLEKRKQRENSTKLSAFFTAITGGYDNVSFHECLNWTADYHLFSSNVEDKYIYNANIAPYFDEDSVRSARFVKTHPHMLLRGYEIAVWIDGNILIRDDLSNLIGKFERSGLPVAAVPHPLRSSVYAEALECIKRGKDDASVIEAQMARYRSEGFDSDELVESNFMMFRLGHPALAPFLSAWWTEIDKGSRRDQLSFNYAMQKTGTDWFPLTERPNSVRNHSALALFHHGSNRCPHEPKAALRSKNRLTYSDVLEERIRGQWDRKVDVVVCVHNALEVVQRCLESVVAYRRPDQHRIVIVNDGSGDETSTWLEWFASEQPNVHLIRHMQAGGYTKAANAGLRAMNADLAILLNSDTIVAGHWIEKMLDAVFTNPGVGIVGPLSSAASHQSIPDHKSTANQTAINDLPNGYTVADMNAWCERNSPADFIPRVPLVHGFCFGLTRDVVERVGYFDEVNFPSGYGEENDYCFRAVNAGFSLAVATHTYVYHEKSQSYQNERRVALVKAGNMKIRELHSPERVARAVRNMQQNPFLKDLRSQAMVLFGTAGSSAV